MRMTRLNRSTRAGAVVRIGFPAVPVATTAALEGATCAPGVTADPLESPEPSGSLAPSRSGAATGE
jgi:hypothetical protein